MLTITSFTSSAAIQKLVIFGDSLSDTGNTASVAGGFPISTFGGYGGNGRFSNGVLWHEYLATSLGLSPATNSRGGGDNFAFGGARVDAAGGASVGLLRQNEEYFDRQNGADSDADALFISWIGGNDVRDLVGNANPLAIIEQQLDALFGTFTGLLNSGVTQLFVPNLPDLGAIPENRGTSNQTAATAVTQAWNSSLFSRLFELNNSTTADIYFFDVFSLFDGLLNNPAAEGFSNTTGQCRSVVFVIFERSCGSPSSFVFWDAIHPTTAAHAVLGQAAFDLVSNRSVLAKVSSPAVFTLFALVLVGIVIRRKTK
jgi:phospholipase/lecithinase/hemolysin